MEPVKKPDRNPIFLCVSKTTDTVENITRSGYELADLIELHKQGILQEANRLFFHPLGLAMVWMLPTGPDDPTEPAIVGLATTDDPEGWAFTDLSQPEHYDNATSVNEIRQRFSAERNRLFGDEVQQIGTRLED